MPQIETVLCPVDFSASSKRELQLATQICQRSGARLVLHHDLQSVPPPCLGAGWMWRESHAAEDESHRARAEHALSELLEKLPPGVQAEAKISKAPLGESILYLADRLQADLIVMATHGRPTPEHEAVTERILLRARCPVLTTRDAGDRTVVPDLGPDATARFPVLIPVDGSEHSVRALRYAFELSGTLPFDFELAQVEGRICWDDLRYATHFNIDEHRRRRLEEARERLETLVPPELAPRTRIEVLLGPPADEILRHAQRQGIRLILMGMHSKGALARWFAGATSCSILYQSTCPVWFVPEGAFLSRRRDLVRAAGAAS